MVPQGRVVACGCRTKRKFSSQYRQMCPWEPNLGWWPHISSNPEPGNWLHCEAKDCVVPSLAGSNMMWYFSLKEGLTSNVPNSMYSSCNILVLISAGMHASTAILTEVKTSLGRCAPSHLPGPGQHVDVTLSLRPIACNYDESSDKTKISKKKKNYLLKRILLVNCFRKCYQNFRSPFTFFKIN